VNNADDVMRLISPAAVLEQIAAAVPEDCRENIIIIGSLAAGYHFFGDNALLMVRTKDADCLLSPRIEAISAGVAITERLFQQNWQFRPDAKWSSPGNEFTPDDQLPAVRLTPPGVPDWFIELLTVPESPSDMNKRWVRLATSAGHFGLCSFGFLSLTNYRPISTPHGIAIARPELMALANLLEHPEIRPETMSGLIAAREIKRSNKDLGRVLAIARLSIGRNEDALLDWPAIWREAMQARFPENWRTLLGRTGAGLRQLLNRPNDLDEARHTCEHGLLASGPPSSEQLRLAGLRLLQDAIEPFGSVR
jgi:hypothetical protein